MFQTEQLIEDCCRALHETNAYRAVKEVVARTVTEPSQLLKALGEPKLASIQTLYRSHQLTILNVLWGPGIYLIPMTIGCGRLSEFAEAGKKMPFIAGVTAD